MRLNFNVGNFKCISLSLYGVFLRLIVSLVAFLNFFSLHEFNSKVDCIYAKSL